MENIRERSEVMRLEYELLAASDVIRALGVELQQKRVWVGGRMLDRAEYSQWKVEKVAELAAAHKRSRVLKLELRKARDVEYEGSTKQRLQVAQEKVAELQREKLLLEERARSAESRVEKLERQYEGLLRSHREAVRCAESMRNGDGAAMVMTG